MRNFAAGSIKIISLFALAVCFNVPLSAAQEASGTFTLPHEVQWNNLRLNAGDYKYTLSGQGSGAILMIRGLRGSPGYILMARKTAHAGATEADRLTIINQDGQAFVSALYVTKLETLFRFEVPAANATMASKRQAVSETAP